MGVVCSAVAAAAVVASCSVSVCLQQCWHLSVFFFMFTYIHKRIGTSTHANASSSKRWQCRTQNKSTSSIKVSHYHNSDDDWNDHRALVQKRMRSYEPMLGNRCLLLIISAAACSLVLLLLGAAETTAPAAEHHTKTQCASAARQDFSTAGMRTCVTKLQALLANLGQ
jgi:hypothetical protein